MATDLADALTIAGIQCRERGTNVGRDHVNICCVFCGEERFHLGIHVHHGYFHCWVCHARGPWPKLKRRFAELGYPVDWAPAGAQFGKRAVAPQSAVPVAQPDELVFEYWRRRGFDEKLVRELGVVKAVGRRRGYFGVPLARGRLWRRYLKVPGPRYFKDPRSSAIFHRTNGVWAIVTEGLFDALSVPSGIALLGTNVSPAAVEEIASIARFKTLLVVLDSATSQSLRDRVVAQLADVADVVDSFPLEVTGAKDLNHLYRLRPQLLDAIVASVACDWQSDPREGHDVGLSSVVGGVPCRHQGGDA